MGIKLYSASLNEPYSYISMQDDAIDTECKDFKDAWQRYRDGQGDPPIKDGEEPTVWELTPVASVSARAKLQGILDAHGQTAWALATAAVGITNVSGLFNEDGSPFKLERRRGADGFTAITEKQLTMIGRDVLMEIGNELIMHSHPNRD